MTPEKEHDEQVILEKVKCQKMFPDYYNYETRECLICNMLLEPDVQFVKQHADEPFHIKKMLEKHFGAKEAKVEEPKKEVTVLEDKQIINRDVSPTMVGSLAEVETRYKQLQEFIKSQMIDGEDYGKIPGCPKPSLLKAGAEKLLEIYGYAVSDIQVVSKVEDWKEGFFHYEMKAVAISKRTGQIIGTGIGACNSKEKKFIKQDPYSIQNTLLKMAKKRAIVDLALLVTRSSGIFTQDVEDMEINGHEVIKHTMTEKQTPQGTEILVEERQEKIPNNVISDKQDKRLFAIRRSNNVPDEVFMDWLNENYGLTDTKKIAREYYDAICEYAQNYQPEQ